MHLLSPALAAATFTVRVQDEVLLLRCQARPHGVTSRDATPADACEVTCVACRRQSRRGTALQAQQEEAVPVSRCRRRRWLLIHAPALASHSHTHVVHLLVSFDAHSSPRISFSLNSRYFVSEMSVEMSKLQHSSFYCLATREPTARPASVCVRHARCEREKDENASFVSIRAFEYNSSSSRSSAS